MLDLLQRVDGFVEVLAGLGKTQSVSKEQVENSSVLTFEGAEIRVSGLHNEVDLDAQKTRLQKLISEKENQVHGFRTRLSNKGYLENAKPEIIEETRNMLASAEADLEAAQRSLTNLD